MKLLRQLIRAVIEEDIEKLDAWAKKSPFEIERQLAKAGVTPVPRGRQRFMDSPDSFVGEGVFAATYEVVYDGKRAVAKVTTSSADVDAYRAAKEMRDKFPRKIARHFPIIYDIFELKDLRHMEPSHVIVMEYLVPMPKNLEAEYFASASEFDIKRNAKMMKDDRDRLHQIVNRIFSKMDPEWIKERDVELMRQRAFKPENDGLWNDFLALAEKRYGTFKIISQIFGEDIDEDARYDMNMALRNEIEGKRFPYSRREDLGTGDSTKGSQIQNLLDAMRRATRYGWSWNDLHRSNVMMRPTTGDLVVSDLGLFGHPGKN